MRVLVTGKNGFLAKNVIEHYLNRGADVVAVSHEEDLSALRDVDVVFHLAAVQRSNNEQDFWLGNVAYTEQIINICECMKRKPIIFFSSSTAVQYDSIFAQTKREAEERIISYSKKNGVSVYIFRLNHIFGKYGKPNFNNVVATFLFNLANEENITLRDPSHKITVTYADDLMLDFDKCLGCEGGNVYQECSIKQEITLGQLLKMLGDIKNGDFEQSKLYHDLKTTYEFYKSEKK